MHHHDLTGNTTTTIIGSQIGGHFTGSAGGLPDGGPSWLHTFKAFCSLALTSAALCIAAIAAVATVVAVVIALRGPGGHYGRSGGSRPISGEMLGARSAADRRASSTDCVASTTAGRRRSACATTSRDRDTYAGSLR